LENISIFLDTFHSNNVEKGYPFGKLRLSEDGKNEELISVSDMYVLILFLFLVYSFLNFSEKSPFKQDQPSSGVQPCLYRTLAFILH